MPTPLPAWQILVLSGKGGVGKSTISTQLALRLAEAGKEACTSFATAGRPRREPCTHPPSPQVGLLDIDICGPSIPKMLGLEGEEIHQSGSGWSPVYPLPNLAVMSIGFLLTDPKDAVVWRGPRKSGLIKQFLKDVDWGALDYLVRVAAPRKGAQPCARRRAGSARSQIVDSPPGTSDEHISIVQYLAGAAVDGAVVVTTPQEVALIDVRKELSFCRKVGLSVLGVVENMSGLSLPLGAVTFSRSGPSGEAQDVTAAVAAALQAAGLGGGELRVGAEVFCSGSRGGELVASEFGVEFLGRVPLDTALTQAAEQGLSAAQAQALASAAHIAAITNRLVGIVEGRTQIKMPPAEQQLE